MPSVLFSPNMAAVGVVRLLCEMLVCQFDAS